MRLKPVNGPFEWIEKVADQSFSLPNLLQKLQATRSIGEDSSQDSQLSVHWCNTRRVIADQTLLEMWSSLVIRIARDQD
jgi:hypothetical protein